MGEVHSRTFLEDLKEGLTYDELKQEPTSDSDSDSE